MRSQVTTRRGDKGESTTLGGEKLSKAHPVMECVGAVDELRAQLALARLGILAERPGAPEADFLFWLLHACFAIGAACSDPLLTKPRWHPAMIGPKHIQRLEEEQMCIEQTTRLPKSFIVSASTMAAAQVDVACTLARRLERRVVALREAVPGFDGSDMVVFLNRLSDYLFMLARSFEGGVHQVVDYEWFEREASPHTENGKTDLGEIDPEET